MKVEVAPSFLKSLKNIDSLKNKWYQVRAWFKYHFTKDFFNIIKVALKGYPWQESFLYDIEKAKLIEMINYHKKVQRFVGWEYVVRDMQLCVNLIDIFNSDGIGLFEYSGDLQFIQSDDDNYEVKGDELKYHCNIYVNTHNINRFVDNENLKKYYIDLPHELYILKAKRLYHKIRYEHDAEWWD